MPETTYHVGTGRLLCQQIAAAVTTIKVYLFTPDLSPTNETTLADFKAAQPAFTNYSAQGFNSWPAPTNFGPVEGVLRSSLLTFAADPVTVTVDGVAAGWFWSTKISDTDPEILLGFGLFDNPVAFVNPGDAVAFVFSWVFGANAPEFQIVP